MGAERVVIVGLARGFVDRVGSEGIGFRGGARREGLGGEFGGGVVADVDARLMLADYIS